MNTKRIIFWFIFVIVLGLIIWGMVVALNKQQSAGPNGERVGTPAPVTTTDHIRYVGGATASSTNKVTLIEYSDFQCPACEAYYPVVEHVLASSTVPIEFVYRHVPLPQHANALITAQASEAAAMQGKFWEMYSLIFPNHAEWTELADPTDILVGYAQRAGLNVQKFKADLTSQPVKTIVDAHLKEARRISLFQTPTFFVNGKMIQNPQNYEQFTSILQAAAR